MNMTDRVIRILIAVVIATMYFMDVITGTPGIILMIAAGILFITGLVGICPLYSLIGLSTKKVK